MSPTGAISLISWVSVSFIIALKLHRRYPFFQKLSGVLALFGCFVLFAILHNLVYGLFHSYFSSRGTDEPVFFILALLSIGAAIFLLVILAAKRVVQVSKDRKRLERD